uniref:signal-transducing adaptor protein 1-like n=1 Tax=Semicossyphus pulcher TaxID=241346 RepID=UPI0037E883AA
MSVHPRVVHKRRETITALPLYHSGRLQKKNSKETDFKKFYGELRGTTLFLYKDDTQDTYTERMDLEKLKSMELDSQKTVPSIFTLALHSEEVQLKMDNPDAGMEWKVYILTVVKKEIPAKLQLLPGQKLQLQEVLAQENRRSTQRPALPPRPAFLPPASPAPSPTKDEPDHTTSEIPECFFKVNRQEAERMLEENPEYGSIILRPSTLAKNYALTLRQLEPSGAVKKKNFRVTSTNSGFVIELDTPVTVSSLNDVINYFLEKTEYRLQPYRPSQSYDSHIDVSPAPKCIRIPSPASKVIPSAKVSPMVRSETKEKLPLSPTDPEEGEYLLPDDDGPEYHNLKLGQFAGELREAVKLRGQNTYVATGEEVVATNQSQATERVSEKSRTSSAQWMRNNFVK